MAIRKLADESDLCDHCIEEQLTTRMISGLYNQETCQKLLFITPFPQLKTVADICMSTESAAKDSMALSQKLKIEKITTSQGNQNKKIQIVPDVYTGSTHKEKNVLLTIVSAKFARKWSLGKSLQQCKMLERTRETEPRNDS